MYAGVPCYNLKKLNSEIKDDLPVPRTLVSAWKKMRETWHRQKEDPDFQFEDFEARGEGFRVAVEQLL